MNKTIGKLFEEGNLDAILDLMLEDPVQSHCCVNIKKSLLHDISTQLRNIITNPSILSIGCGTGLFEVLLKHYLEAQGVLVNLTGVDCAQTNIFLPANNFICQHSCAPFFGISTNVLIYFSVFLSFGRQHPALRLFKKAVFVD